MPESTSNSLVNLGDVSKPADTLIKKVSEAVGGVFAPYQIKRVAKAEAEVAILKAQTELEITDLHRRAMHRFMGEEAQRQQNIEEITNKAIPQLKDESDAGAMEDDWITNFFDKSRIVSDKQMQDLWASVLAGEANVPGTYSKRTVNFLGDLDKRDAELFQALCSFGWYIGGFSPLVFDVNAEIYAKNGIDFNALNHLDSIGLIQFNNLSGFIRKGLPKTFTVFYCGKPLTLTLEKEKDNSLKIGCVLLSQIGMELAAICNSPGIVDFEDYVKENWKCHLLDDTQD